MPPTNPSPAGYNWLKALTDGPNFERTTAVTITLSLSTSTSTSNAPHPTPDIEPPPQLDYGLLHNLIHLSPQALTAADKTRYTDLTAARKAYYHAHARFTHAWHGLADAQAYERILDAERREIGAAGERRAGQWADCERLKEMNARDLVARLGEVRRAVEVRAALTRVLGREKRAFVERDGSRLAFLCRHAYGRWRAGVGTAVRPATVTAVGPTHSTAATRKHPTKYKFRLPATSGAPRVEAANDQSERASPGHISTETDSARSQETSDSDKCPDCVREERAERRRTKAAGATRSKPAVMSSSGAVKRTHSDMTGDLPD